MTASRRPSADAKWYPLAGFLLLGGPIWAELYQSGYPLGNPEAVLLPIIAGGVGLVAAILAGRLREPLRTAALALPVIAFLDLQFDLERHLAPPLIAVAALAAVALLRQHRALLTVVTLSGFYLSTLPARWRERPPPPTPVSPSDRPVLLHVILDGQWGPAGFQAAGDSATASELDEFYRARGFRLFGGAYSRYSATRYSLGSLVALGGDPPVRPVGGGAFLLTANPYFDYLARRGYRLRVFQSTHLDYCPRDPPGTRAAAVQCQAASSGAIGNVGHLSGRWQPRAVLTTRFLLGVRSYLYRGLRGREPVPIRRSAAGRAVTWSETVRRAIAANEADAYFVHLILPHAPFEVDSACVGFSSVGLRLANNDAAGAPESRRLAAYAGQSRCAHRVLDGLLATLDSVAGPRSIVVVHGDHGPKLVAAGRRLADYTPEALNHYFATLFAVRAPSITAGRVSEAAAIQDLLRELVASDFAEVGLGIEAPYVIARSGSGGRDSIRVLTPGEVLWASSAASPLP